MRLKPNKSLGLFGKSFLGLKAIGFDARDQRHVSLWRNARSSRPSMGNVSAFSFRQRHGGGRCVPVPFQPSLRLHFTFPSAEPLTEACR
jgi:hypothetical protein